MKSARESLNRITSVCARFCRIGRADLPSRDLRPFRVGSTSAERLFEGLPPGFQRALIAPHRRLRVLMPGLQLCALVPGLRLEVRDHRPAEAMPRRLLRIDVRGLAQPVQQLVQRLLVVRVPVPRQEQVIGIVVLLVVAGSRRTVGSVDPGKTRSAARTIPCTSDT